VCVPVQAATEESEDPRPNAGSIVYLNPITEEMHSVSVRVCVNEGVVPATEWGCGLRDSYVQVPVTGETGIQRPATT